MDLSKSVRYRPGGRFSIPGMLLAILLGSIGVFIAGSILFLIGSLVNCFIPFVFPILLGMLAGGIMVFLSAAVGRSHNQLVSTGAAMIVGLVGGLAGHIFDYLLFIGQVVGQIMAEAPVGLGEANWIINQWLVEETGQSGFWGFILLKMNTGDVTLESFYQGVPITNVQLTGGGLFFFWLVEILMVIFMAAIFNWTHERPPFCPRCDRDLNCKVITIGSADNLDAAITALEGGAYAEGIAALGTHEENGFSRLQIEFCSKCDTDAVLTLSLVEGEERLVWMADLAPEVVPTVLELIR